MTGHSSNGLNNCGKLSELLARLTLQEDTRALYCTYPILLPVPLYGPEKLRSALKPIRHFSSAHHKCLKDLVVDGVIVRQKTDDAHPGSPDYPQQRSCLKGRSQRKQVYAPDRLRYPMKRKHWDLLGRGQKIAPGLINALLLTNL